MNILLLGTSLPHLHLDSILGPRLDPCCAPYLPLPATPLLGASDVADRPVVPKLCERVVMLYYLEEVILNEERTTDEEKMKIIEGRKLILHIALSYHARQHRTRDFPAFSWVLSVWLAVRVMAVCPVRAINRSTSERAARRKSAQREMLYVLIVYPAFCTQLKAGPRAYAPTSLTLSGCFCAVRPSAVFAS